LGELRSIAASLFRGECESHTLQADALVNEALSGSRPSHDLITVIDHFLRIAATTLRRISHRSRKGAPT
jgi:hypothetical protein